MTDALVAEAPKAEEAKVEDATAVKAEPNGEDDVAAERAKALAAIAALKSKVQGDPALKKEEDQNGAAPADAQPARPRKHRFGPPANAPREAPKPRKRKSRWATEETSDSRALIINDRNRWPTDVTLPGGITVRPGMYSLAISLHGRSSCRALLRHCQSCSGLQHSGLESAASSVVAVNFAAGPAEPPHAAPSTIVCDVTSHATVLRAHTRTGHSTPALHAPAPPPPPRSPPPRACTPRAGVMLENSRTRV